VAAAPPGAGSSTLEQKHWVFNYTQQVKIMAKNAPVQTHLLTKSDTYDSIGFFNNTKV
jgi:hypothetical protein